MEKPKIKSRNGNIFQEIEFYPNGQVMCKQATTYRKEYAENGFLITEYHWKFKTDKQISDNYMVVNKRKYDQNGRLIEILIYEIWEQTVKQGFYKNDKPDWIIDYQLFRIKN